MFGKLEYAFIDKMNFFKQYNVSYDMGCNI